MGEVAIVALLGSILLACLIMFVAAFFPFVTIFHCARRHDMHKNLRVLWIAAMTLFWTPAAIVYGVSETQNHRLIRWFSWVSLAFLGLLVVSTILTQKQIKLQTNAALKTSYSVLKTKKPIAELAAESRKELRSQIRNTSQYFKSLGLFDLFVKYEVYKAATFLENAIGDQRLTRVELGRWNISYNAFAGHWKKTQFRESEAVKKPSENSSIKISSPDLLILDGLMEAMYGNHEKAITFYDKVLKDDPGNIQARVQRGGSLIAMGKNDSGTEELQISIQNLESQIKKEPKNDRLYYFRASAYRYLKNYKSAEADLLKAIDLNPERDSYRSDLKMIRMNLK